jgi:hypothetical protein
VRKYQVPRVPGRCSHLIAVRKVAHHDLHALSLSRATLATHENRLVLRVPWTGACVRPQSQRARPYKLCAVLSRAEKEEEEQEEQAAARRAGRTSVEPLRIMFEYAASATA